MSSLRNIEPILADGTIYRLEYNGFRFDPAATETTRISLNPVQDSAKRTITDVELILEVRTIVYVGNGDPQTTDTAMNDLRQRLMSQGAYLVYQGKGFGTFNINTGKLAGTGNSPMWDVAWGPTPMGATAKPIADNKAWEVTWGVKVRIPLCDSARYMDTPMAFCYSVTYNNDYGGYSTRDIAGYLEIPLTRPDLGNRRITKTADDYRDQIIVNCPAGYRVTNPGHFVVSEDRRRLDFSFQHEQLPGQVPPLGIVRCSMRMRMNNQKAMVFVKHFFTIEAEYELARGELHTVAANHFFAVCKDRYERLKQIPPGRANLANDGGGLMPPIGGDVKPKPTGVQGRDAAGNGAKIASGAFRGALWGVMLGAGLPGAVVGGVYGGLTATPSKSSKPGAGVSGNSITITGNTKPNLVVKENGTKVLMLFFSAEEPDAYGKPIARFSATFSVIGTRAGMLIDGLYEPIVKTPTHEQWKVSIGRIWNVRGNGYTKFDASDDLIIDLCRPGPTETENTLTNPARGGNPKLKALRNNVGDAPSETSKLGTVSISDQQCWIAWENKVKTSQVNNLAKFKKLPTDLVTVSQNPVGYSSVTPEGWDDTITQFSAINGISIEEGVTSLTNTADPDYTFEMSGYAIACGFVPEVPQAVTLGGVPCVLEYGTSISEPVGNTGEPVFKTSWVLTYTLPQSAGGSGSSGTDVGGTSSLRSGGMGGGTSSLKSLGA